MGWVLQTNGRRTAALALALSLSCAPDPILFDVEFGRAIPLASGDEHRIPRLLFIDEGCPGSAAAGGCPTSGSRTCEPIIIDTLSSLTTLRSPDNGTSFQRECLEVRAGEGMLALDPSEDAYTASVARFRFRDLPVVRAPRDGTPDWTWTAGSSTDPIEPGGVLGGNLLNDVAVSIRSPPETDNSAPTVALFRSFPGDESDLANQGLANIPVQFPGRLLGFTVGDRCDIGGQDCRIDGFYLDGEIPVALEASRWVLDACVAVPPCSLRYDLDPTNPFAPGQCVTSPGLDLTDACTDITDPTTGGRPASMVLATGLEGMALFADSAERMFGALDALPACTEPPQALIDVPACREQVDEVLYLSGWPAVGSLDEPMTVLRIRSLALVSGLSESRGADPCLRAQTRWDGLVRQCERFVEVFTLTDNIALTTPPYAPDNGPSPTLAAMGELWWPTGSTAPDPSTWIRTAIIPADHPAAVHIRRDVAPDATEPDGLIGTVLFDESEVVLDATEETPTLRMMCLEPQSGRCLAAPQCTQDGASACCFGQPIDALVEYIEAAGDETCCGALSAVELDEIQDYGHCLSTLPP